MVLRFKKIIGLYLFVSILLPNIIFFASTINYTYDSLNRLTKVDYGNGSVEEYSYDSSGNRLTFIVLSDTTFPITTATPAGGTYNTTQIVTLTANETASIYYTTNGLTPTINSPVYTAPINILINTTLKFFAIDLAGNPESVKTEIYKINRMPLVTLNVNYHSGNVPLSLHFMANAYDTDGVIEKYEWDFDGNGNYDTSILDSTISYTYNSVGIYNAKVRVTDNDSAIAEDSITIEVLSPSTPRSLASGLNYPYAIAVDSLSVYWTEFNNGGSVKKMGVNGGLVTTLASGVHSPYSIAVDSASVYWTDQDSSGVIKKIGLNGGSITILASGLTGPLRCIAIDSTNVYWIEYNNPGAVKKVGKNGGSVTALASGLNGPFGIAVDSASVYWTELESGFVKKVGKNGGAVTTLASGLNSPIHILVDSTSVYWTSGNSGTVSKVGINGGSVTTIASSLHSPFGLAIDSTSVYWTELGTELFRTVKKVGKNGGLVTALESTSVNTPLCIAVDSTSVYWTEANYITWTNGIGDGTVMKVAKGETVTPSPIVNLDVDYDSGYVPLSVNLTANAYDTDGVIVNYKWDFNGDDFYDSTTLDSTISYTYNTAGIYNAKVRVTDNDNTMAEDSIMIVVSPENELPVVTLTAIPNSGEAPLSVSLTADASDPDGAVVKYEWDFDYNGIYDLITVNNIINHTYNAPGKYNPKVRVTDNEGATAETTAIVNVTTLIAGNIDITSPGSANRVDGYDLFILAKAFNSRPGDKNWNPSADLNNDLKVDGEDLIILAYKYVK